MKTMCTSARLARGTMPNHILQNAVPGMYYPVRKGHKRDSGMTYGSQRWSNAHTCCNLVPGSSVIKQQQTLLYETWWSSISFSDCWTNWVSLSNWGREQLLHKPMLLFNIRHYENTDGLQSILIGPSSCSWVPLLNTPHFASLLLNCLPYR